MAETLKPGDAAQPNEDQEFPDQLVVGFFLFAFVSVLLFTVTQWLLR